MATAPRAHNDMVLPDTPKLPSESLPWHRRSICVRFVIPFVLFVSACSSTSADTTTRLEPPERQAIELSMSLYVVVEAGDPESVLSSERELVELDDIASRMRNIWDQAGIDLVLKTVSRIEISPEVLTDLAEGNTASFISAAAGGLIAVPGAATINGFYVRSLGTANGIAPFGTHAFFVTDNPSVHDERVSSHELGHILGLHHATTDSDRLMFSGTNGMELVQPEVDAARYAATGILDGVR